MILRQDGNDLIRICLPQNTTEELFMEMNPEFIQTNTVYSVSGYYTQVNGVIEVNLQKELEVLKAQKMELVSLKFDSLMAGGNFDCSLGFNVDNRRGDGKDDKDNVNSLIDLGNEPVYFKDTTNSFHALTIADLKTLKQEMIQDGLGKYQWKWTKQNEIMQATTIQELEAITI